MLHVAKIAIIFYMEGVKDKKIHPHSEGWERIRYVNVSLFHLLNLKHDDETIYIITTRPPPSLKFAVCVKRGVGGVYGSFIHL